MDKRENVISLFNSMGIESSSHIFNEKYWRRRLLKLFQFNWGHYARILGEKDCYMDLYEYISYMVKDKERIIEFMEKYFTDDLSHI